jgi:hypothetical protein
MMGRSGAARILFITIVAMELTHTAVAVLQHRAPVGHDGFQYFTIQYYFLNNAIQTHEVAQWIPYMNQGTVATFWYGIQGSFLQNVLLYTASPLRNVDLLSVFHVAIFVDEMILLIGTWLLARRFFHVPSVFFVAVSVVGSSVWLDQPYWNFRLYYAIPLVLELGHRFLDTGRWRWVFLAANLLALQTVGTLPYLIPIVSFTVFAYFAGYWVANRRVLRERVASLQWRWPAWLSIAAGVLSFVVTYKYLTIGTDELVSYNPGRNRDGTTSLSDFLTYGGATDLHKWIDTVLNISPWLDITLYAGILLAPLLLCGLCVTDRRRIHFVMLAVTLLLFTLGTAVSAALFYAWPGMKYFRHIGLVSPLVKVLFCFVAGMGFEWLFEEHPWRTSRATALTAGAGAALLIGAALLAHRIANSGASLVPYVSALVGPNVDRPIHTYQQNVLAHRLRASTALGLAGAAIIGIAPVLLDFCRFGRAPRVRAIVLCAILAFVTADLYHFKFAYLFDRSGVINPDARFVTRASPMPYPARRERDLKHAAAAGTSPRLRAALNFNPMLRLHLQGQRARGAEYWSNNVFLFADEAGSSFHVDSWLKPLDELMRMYWRGPIDDTRTAPPGLASGSLQFPLDHIAAGKAAGVTEDKVRFFTHAYTVASPNDLVPLMTDPSYAGNLLFVLPTEDAGGQHGPAQWTSQQALSKDDSRRLSYEVQQFDANNVVIKVSNLESAEVWISYADVWHPSWHATVNGRPTPVYRANMAYKAVLLGAGDNLVHFNFGSKLFSSISVLLSANAALWLGAIAWMTFDLLRHPVHE